MAKSTKTAESKSPARKRSTTPKAIKVKATRAYFDKVLDRRVARDEVVEMSRKRVSELVAKKLVKEI